MELFEFDDYKFVDKIKPNSNYGLGYIGSKNLIVKDLMMCFPKATNFYDLFAGGCSVSHCAMLSGKYKNYYINDLDPQPIELFENAIKGKYRNETRWISREDFKKLKDTDAYVAYVWSFSNNCKDYMYSREIELYKKACHYAIVFDDWSLMKELCSEVVDYVKGKLNGYCDLKLRRLRFGQAVVRKLKKLNDWGIVVNNPLYKSCHWRGGKLDSNFYVDLESLQSLEGLERLQSLEGLERLQSLEGLERLQSLEGLEFDNIKFSNLSYDEIEIKDNSVIYCDIPYFNTVNYKIGCFDYDKFYNWCKNQKQITFVSSYELPEDKFYLVEEFNKNSTFQSGAKSRKERLYVPIHQKNMLNENIGLF